MKSDTKIFRNVRDVSIFTKIFCSTTGGMSPAMETSRSVSWWRELRKEERADHGLETSSSSSLRGNSKTEQ